MYLKAGADRGTADDELKQRAVRKVVRALIEREGGNGKVIKARIDARYPRGAVWWKGEGEKWEKVAQWNALERNMRLQGSAAALQQTVDEFMK